MFTVSDKDVVLRVSIAALFFVLMIPHIIYSRAAHEKITGETATRYTHSNATYDSYENYLPEKKDDASAPGLKQKRNNAATSLKGQSKKQSRGINKKNMTRTRYSVRKGDTLTSIAKKYGITVSSLRSSNHLANRNSIKKGITLMIPIRQALPVPGSKTKTIKDLDPVQQNKPRFLWPTKTVIDYHNDGLNGVKSIGIIITTRPGSTVHSSASGTVKKIGRMRGFGNYIVINHSGRYSTVYSNLDMILVSQGDTISAGNAIGKMSTTEQKMHFQIDREGKPEDPLRYLPKNI